MSWIAETQQGLREFADARDWHRFHTVPNLIASVAIEAGELLELVQWGEDRPPLNRLAEEMADVAIYLIRLADVAGVDLEYAVRCKISTNARKYPA